MVNLSSLHNMTFFFAKHFIDDYASRGFITGSQLSQNDALPDLEEYSSNVMLGFPKPDNQNLNMEPKSRKKQLLLSPPPNTMKTSSSVISGQKQVTIPGKKFVAHLLHI